MFFDLFIPADGRAFKVRPGRPLTIGRMPQCEVQVDDQAVSRRHCTIEAAADSLHVLDLGSANGTFLNDAAIERAQMAPGDRLRVGSTVFECRPADVKVTDDTAYLTMDHSTIESVIRKRIEPSQLEWLSSAQSATPEQTLLGRAQRHLSMLHSVSELLAGARDVQTVSDDVVRTVLDVIGADRGALLLRRGNGTDGDEAIQLTAAYTK